MGYRVRCFQGMRVCRNRLVHAFVLATLKIGCDCETRFVLYGPDTVNKLPLKPLNSTWTKELTFLGFLIMISLYKSLER